MTGGYTILNLGGNLFTVAATDETAEGKTVEGIYERIERNNPNKPFLLENYSFEEGTEENAKFVGFSEVEGGSFEGAFYVNWRDPSSQVFRVNLCFVKVESDDTVKFFRAHKV